MNSPDRETILIVEDDPGVAQLQLRRLKRAGFGVLLAGTAAEALAQLRAHPVHLVLMDNHLPGNLTGFDCYAMMKEAGFHPPIIMVTGFSDETTAISALRSGVRDFVSKSVEYLDYLPSAVERVLVQVRLEQQLIESEERFQAFMDHHSAIAFIKDEAGRYIYFNRPYEQRFRLQHGEWLGKIDFDLWSAETAASLVEHDRVVLEENQTVEFVEAVPTPDEGVRQWWMIKFPFKDSAGSKLLGGLGVDITKRLQAEERIREQAMLLDQATDAIVVQDVDDRIQFWNQGAHRIYGWTVAEAVGQNALELLYASPTAAREQARRTALEKGEWSGELKQVAKDGRQVLVASRWTLLRNDQGQPRAILVINTDITETKKLEQQLLRAQRMESLGTLAGGIAHDLNNMLTPIMMAVGLLETPLDDAQRLAVLDTLRSSVQVGAEMVRQVLLFARGTEGDHMALHVTSIVKEIAKMAAHSFPKSIEILTKMPDDPWSVHGEPTQLTQVLMNLCVNARDAMPDGGRLNIAVANVVLDEQYCNMHVNARPGPYVRITVADTGIGIPPEIMDRIFDPFFTTKEHGKGTGLGLSTVIGIVKSHGGFVNVYSEVGKGTKFSIFLPAGDAAAAVPRRLSDTRTKGNGELILVVDDESVIRDIAKQTLEHYGYRVLTAKDGTEAVALFVQHRQEIQAVLTDMMMPIMDGSATIRALQRLDPAVRIIAASGLSDNHKLADKTNGGVQAFLLKPYTARALVETLQSVLRA